ncbi:MAG: lipopolysaccharide biosynthesis protein, partial [Myxococcales bacterium]|nr:lipopolysaccharide biosynthesis protein [Myxococcales bacterium]
MARVTLGRLVRSSGLAGLAQVVRAASSMVLTPIVLGAIGLEGFGVWALLFSLSNSINVIGVSFGNAYAKFTADFEARRDFDGLAERVGAGLVLIGGVAALGLVGLALASEWLLRMSSVPEAMLPEARTGFLIVCVTVFSMLSIGCVRQILAGLQRTDLSSVGQIATSLAYLALGWTLVRRGHGIVGLAVANLAAELAGIALSWVWCRRVCPQLVLSPLRATRAGLREVVALGGRFQLVFALNFLSNEGFKIALSSLLGPAVLGSYELARRMMRLCQTAAGAIHTPMMPAFAQLHSGGESERARHMHNRGALALFTAALVAIGFVAVFAERTMLVWTADPQPLAAWTFRALAAAYVFKQLSSMATANLRGRGEFRLEIGSMVFSLVARLGLIVPLYAWLDYAGFVWSEAIAHVATALVLLWPYAGREGIALGRFFWEAAARPTLLLALPLAAAWAGAHAWPLPLGDVAPRWQAFFELALWGALFSAASAGVVWFGLLASDERARLGRSLARRFGRGRRP